MLKYFLKTSKHPYKSPENDFFDAQNCETRVSPQSKVSMFGFNFDLRAQIFLYWSLKILAQIIPKKSMLVGQNFRWLYKPIGELFRKITKFAKYYLPQCIITEIFIEFKRKKCDPPPPPPAIINVAIVVGNGT